MQGINYQVTYLVRARLAWLARLGSLRGPTHFWGVILYLWTDPGEINTAYVKLKKKCFLFMKFF